MASWGCLPQQGSNTRTMNPAQSQALLPARPTHASRRAGRQGTVQTSAQSVRPQARAVAAPPQEQLQQAEKPVVKTNGADVEGPIILNGVRDETGAAPTPWGRWTRQWTAEENRHGDAMNKYMYLSGKVNLKAIEVTIQNLIGSGMDPKTENNPYLGFIYTSFQERATKISHGSTARHAKEYGDNMLATLCGAVASDEGRHEIAYSRIVSKLFETDPSGTMLAFEEMMKKSIVMPAHLMDDNEHQAKNGRNLFADFSEVAQATKTYTAHDYADILDHLIKHWDINSLTGLSDEGQRALDYVSKLPPRVRRLADARDRKQAKKEPVTTKFSWIFDRPVDIIPG